MNNLKKTILIDLDGVLNTYSGKYDESYIPPIAKGAYQFIKDLSDEYKILVFTSRNLLLTSKWIIENNLEKYIDNVTNVKEPNYLIIDDRCINFNGDFTELKKKINNFKVWYK
ncbi:MAG: hypothetical protein ACI37Q_00870 [Candidatus Gastranaerophilaceae bacterium]